MTIRTTLFALAACFLAATPLSAQTSDVLNFVDHISVDFARDTILNTNVALYYRNAFGELQGPPAYTAYDDATFYLFSNRTIDSFKYNANGMIRTDVNYPTGWQTPFVFGTDVSLSQAGEVSYTPIATLHDGPNVSDKYSEQQAAITGSRASLYGFNLVSQTRWLWNTLSTGPSGPPYRQGNAVLTTGFGITLLTSNGGIYVADQTDPSPEPSRMVAPLVTAQGTGPGELSNPSAMNVGPDGLLYVLDYGLNEAGESSGVNRIEKFDLATGEYRGQFFLPDGVTVFSTSLAISLDGRIYLGDGLGGGSVFDLAGNLLGTFHPPAADPSWVDGGLTAGSSAGPSFLQYDGLGNIFTYVDGQGIFMYHDPTFVATPEPSTWALASAGLLGLIVLRRRQVVKRHRAATPLLKTF